MSAWVAALLLFLSTVTTTAYVALENASAPVRVLRARVEQEVLLSQQADHIVRRLEEDDTPLADSTHDGVWQYMRALSGFGIEATLEDLSWRSEECPFVDIDLAPIPALEELFRDYGIDAESARSAAAALAGDRRSGGRTGISGVAGAHSGAVDALMPLLRTEPMINVNLAPEHAIRLALARQLGAPKTVARVLSDLLSLRRSVEIDQRSLDLLLSRASCNLPPRRLGVRTWTWRLIVSSGEVRLERTFARVAGPSERGFVTIGDCFEGTGAAHER